MPLTRRVTFKTNLRKHNRLQIPRPIRAQYKLETTQPLKATITKPAAIGAKETFYIQMRKDGCITIPYLAISTLKTNQPTQEPIVLEVTLEPA